MRIFDLVNHEGSKTYASRDNLLTALERDLGDEGYTAYLFVNAEGRHVAAVRWDGDKTYLIGVSAHKGWLTI